MPYALYLDPNLRTTLPMVKHLPFSQRVRDGEPVGSPRYRALLAAMQQPVLAGVFAAHATAFSELAQPAEQRSYHAGAMGAVALALIALDSSPLPRQEYTRLAVNALYEAATGETYSGSAPLGVVQESGAVQERPGRGW